MIGRLKVVGIGYLAPRTLREQSGTLQESPGAARTGQESLGRHQEPLENDTSESQKKLDFGLWDVSGGFRKTQNRSNGLAGAEEKLIAAPLRTPSRKGAKLRAICSLLPAQLGEQMR